MAAGYTGTIDMANYNLEVTGPMTVPGVGVYTKGTGTLTASGGAAQSWNLGGAIIRDVNGEPVLDTGGGLIYGTTSTTVEDIVINKSAGTLTLTGDVRTDSFTMTAGTLDPNGQAVETTGNFAITSSGDMAAGTNVMNESSWTIGGAFSVMGGEGNLLNLRGTATWFLNVTGSAEAMYVDVSYSDASAGTEIDSDVSSTNSLNNTNWNFVGGGGGGSVGALLSLTGNQELRGNW
jgi:hypothetical protein